MCLLVVGCWVLCVCAGCPLVVRWLCVGCALDVCWLCVGRVLVVCWLCVLVVCWLCVSVCRLKPFLLKTALLLRVRLFVLVSSLLRLNKPECNAPQGMEYHGRAQWLVAGHPRTAAAVRRISRVPSPSRAQSRRRQAQSPFGDPQLRVTAAQELVAKLEAALAALHGVDGPEVESLRVALKRAKEVKVQPVDVQIKECEGFLSRARAHLTELDAKRTTVSTNIRLEALKQMQQFSPPPPVDAEAELLQFLETCPYEWSVLSRKASNGGGTSI